MPNFDGTGPAGQGSGTGRGLGACQSGQSQKTGFSGRGRGGRFCPRNAVTSLKEEEKFLEQRLEVVREAKKDVPKKND